MTARLAVVTGGAGGIGRAVCLRLARCGHRVVALGRTADPLELLVADARSQGLDLDTRVCDVTDEDAVADTLAGLDHPQILVNNAGMAGTAPVHRTTLRDWDRHLTVNATSALLMTRAVLPNMLSAGWGRIVSLASTAAQVGTPYTAAYSASKHAMLGLSKVVAAEVVGTGVTSNCVCPTFVRTPMTENSVRRISERTGRDTDSAEAALAAASPLGRLLEPDEVAAAVGYLVSEEAGCVNGQSLLLDGGGVQT